MALGESRVTIIAGGGQSRPSAANVAKTVVQLGVAPGGETETVYAFQSMSAAESVLDTGPLMEAIAMRMRSGLTAYAVVLPPSVAGDIGDVVHSGTDDGTVTVTVGPHKLIEVLCSTGGDLGTAKFRFRVGGTGAYSDEITSTASSWAYLVPGTFTTLTFASATYVATKTLTVGVNGVVTAGSGWVGTVTQASSPIDFYEVIATVIGEGGLGEASLRISLDGGKTVLPDMAIPSGGVIVIPGTGLVLTCANTFTTDETYEFLARSPTCSSQELSDALDALRADDSVAAALIHVIDLPATAAAAFTQASGLNTAIQAAFDSDEIDWQGLCECPYVDDLVIDSSVVVLDEDDDEEEIRDQREDLDLRRTAVQVGTHRMTSPITGRQTRRPLGWAMAARFVDTNPKDDLAALEPNGPLAISEIGRNELTAETSLHDVQLNVVRSYRGRDGAYLAIQDGGFGYKHLTTQADFQDAGGVRALNVGVRALRVAAQSLIGQRPPTNPDGTPTEKIRLAWTKRLDDVIKGALGLVPGGDYAEPQVSFASAEVLASSQLGASPYRVDIEYVIQKLGFVSGVSSTVRYSGRISVGG